MKIKEVTFTISYPHFEPGEKVRLKDPSQYDGIFPALWHVNHGKEYVVDECYPPSHSGGKGFVRLEESMHLVLADLLEPVETSNK